MNLTAKQEKFCQLVAKGSNYSDAYRGAYPTSLKWADNTVNNKASELANDGYTRGRIKELKAKIEAKVIEGFAKTKDDLLKELENIKEKANYIEADKGLKEKRECIKEQGKLLGYYEDTVNMKGQFSILEGLRKFKERGNKPEED